MLPGDTCYPWATFRERRSVATGPTSPSTMVWSTGRYIADGAAAVHITTTAYRSDRPLGLVVEWRLVWPGLYSCYCCWETRQLGPGLWHGGRNSQDFAAAGRSNHAPGPWLCSRAWDAQGLRCFCWGCGQIGLPTGLQVVEPD